MRIDEADTALKSFEVDLRGFKNLQVRYNEEKQRDDAADLYNRNFFEWKDKFEKAVNEIR